MADELDDEERALLAKHRAAKAKKQPGRKVTVRGKHDSGAEYSFDLDGDDAERVISRHKGLWADEDGPDDDDDEDQGDDDESGDDDEDQGGGQGGGKGGGKSAAGASSDAAGTRRKGPYFKQ